MVRRLSRKDAGERLAAPLSIAARGGCAAIGLVLLALLALAAWLSPDPYGEGYGTHRQLGLPPCSFIQVFGFRCPSCGMTTAWSYVVRGRLQSAVAANAGGALTAIIAALAAPWCLAAAARGRCLVWRPTAVVWLTLTFTVLAVTLVDWGLRLWLG